MNERPPLGPHKHTHTVVMEYDCSAPDKESCVVAEMGLDEAIIKAVEEHINRPVMMN